MSKLHGIRAKIARADQHIRDLKHELAVFAENNPNRECVVPETDPKTGGEYHRIRFRTPIGDAIPLIAGDAAHNLRSALDHLACQLAPDRHGNPDRSTYFPVCRTVGDFRHANTQRKINRIPASVIPRIEAKQPYHSGYELLGVLGELDNADKHRLLLVVANALTGTTFGMPDLGKALAGRAPGEEFLLARLDLITPNSGPRVLQDGDVLCGVLPVDGKVPDVKLDFTTAVTFREPTEAEGMFVGTTLDEISKLVKQVVDDFAPLLS